MAVADYTAGESQGQILRKGVIWNSLWSGTGFDSNVGRPFYLASGTDGGIQASADNTNSDYILGWIEPHDRPDALTGASVYSVTGGVKLRFDPKWSIIS